MYLLSSHFSPLFCSIDIYRVGASFIPELKAHGDIDSVAVVLRFPNGQIATIDNNRSAGKNYLSKEKYYDIILSLSDIGDHSLT